MPKSSNTFYFCFEMSLSLPVCSEFWSTAMVVHVTLCIQFLLRSFKKLHYLDFPREVFLLKKTSHNRFFPFPPNSSNHPSPDVRLRTNLASVKMFRYLWLSSKFLCISSHFISTDCHFIFKDFLRPFITCCLAQDRFAQFCENSSVHFLPGTWRILT